MKGIYESMDYSIDGHQIIFYTSIAKKYAVALWGDFSVGDLDNSGKIDLADVQTALRAALKITTLREAQRRASDVDGNGNVDLADAWKLLRVVLKAESL